jgi:membrane protein YdbS with pleckstrin-like domain
MYLMSRSIKFKTILTAVIQLFIVPVRRKIIYYKFQRKIALLHEVLFILD